MFLLWINYGTSDSEWYPACQEIMKLTRTLSSPESFYKYIILKLTRKLLVKNKSMSKNTQLDEDKDLSFLRSDQKSQQFGLEVE